MQWKIDRRRFAVSILIVAVWFTGFGFGWRHVGGGYNTAIGHASVLVWRMLATSEASFVRASSREISLLVERPLPDGNLLRIPYSYSGYFQVSVALVVALFILTPVFSAVSRLLACLAVLPCMFVFHAFYLTWSLRIGIARSVLPQLGIDASQSVQWTYRLLALAKFVIPLMLWGLAIFVLLKAMRRRTM